MWNLLIKFLNSLISALGFILSFLVSILPDSPFIILQEYSPPSLIQGLAWLVPFDFIFSILQAWLVSISIYYVYMVAMRWIKLLD